jgi:hypothetical protein
MLQTEEMEAQQPTGSTKKVAGAIDQMAQYTHAPMVQALQCILCQSISNRTPIMKQYCLLSGILGQAQVAHHSEEQTVVREALLESMQTCRASLQEFIARETNNTSTDGMLAHEVTHRSSCDGAITPKLSPGFCVLSVPMICTFLLLTIFRPRKLIFDSFKLLEFAPASSPIPLD